jgi:hypothetical protein
MTHADGGDLEEWCGIVSGKVRAFADRFGCTPAAVVRAAQDVDLLFDTAREKGRGRQDRPTDPALRCIGLTSEGAERLEALVDEPSSQPDFDNDSSSPQAPQGVAHPRPGAGG